MTVGRLACSGDLPGTRWHTSFGLEGIALLRAWAGDFDKDFVDARLAEVRALLDDPRLASHPGVHVWRGDVEAGYRQWAGSYDEPRNGLFDIEEPVMHEILDSLPAGRAIDAACGTGRYSEYLAGRGHTVLGVDRSPEMLAVARAGCRAASFGRVRSNTFLLLIAPLMWWCPRLPSPMYPHSVPSWRNSRGCFDRRGTW